MPFLVSGMALVKVACLVTGMSANLLSAIPPSSSKTVSVQKDDKIVHEKGSLSLRPNRLPMIMAHAGVLQTALYVCLMGYGYHVSDSTTMDKQVLAALVQLHTVKPWHLVAGTTAVLGCALRKWSFVTLDRFFTYQLTIRSGHKLISTGPYTFLRHPSYTGGMINGVSFYLMLFHQGLWDVLVAYLSAHSKSIPLVSSLLSSPSLLSVPGGIWFVAMTSTLMFSALVLRVVNEESMLKDHFGKDWDHYASKRWRMIPFIY